MSTEGAERALLSAVADLGGRASLYWTELPDLGGSLEDIEALARDGLVTHRTAYNFGDVEDVALTPAGWAKLGRAPPEPWWRQFLPKRKAGA